MPLPGKLASRAACSLILYEVRSIWNAAGTRISLLSEKYALHTLVREWKNSKATTKTAFVSQFKDRLHKLFDLSKCKCRIYGYAEQSCDGWQYQVYVICDCPRKMIPKMDLKFIKSQRSKFGDKADMEMGFSDTKQSRRLTRFLERKRGRI